MADTRGINVWCAAGKSLFSTAEIIRSVTTSRLTEIVSHREIILPQLGATGTSALKIKKGCGFKVTYGPVQAKDLSAFIQAGNVATEAMRTVTFSLGQRMELIPVELFMLAKPLVITLFALFLISGIGPNIFSFSAAWTRGLVMASATLFGIAAGTVLVPLLLPYLPWKQFSPKGALIGAMVGILNVALFSNAINAGESMALLLWPSVVGSYLAMNFTGSTPYTSPTGVEQEMRRSIPWQASCGLLALVQWVIAPFIG